MVNPFEIDRLYYSRAARSTLDENNAGFLNPLLAMLIVNSRLQIPLSEFEFTYARSSGPGGQNVNKVNSKALLRWPVRQSPSLTAEVRERFLRRFASRLTNEGGIADQQPALPRPGAECRGLPGKAARHGG